MKKILLLSDNHGYFGNEILAHALQADEVWHAGDIGSLVSIQPLMDALPFKAVYGNIDDHMMRRTFPLNQMFECEGLRVFMTHIGGYPGRYDARVRETIRSERPGLFICGHSHICKVMPDREHQLLHMNPGAYGHHGFHVMRTMLAFSVDEGKIADVRAIELGRRGRGVGVV
jgi:putative phosphoesterase